MAPDVRRREVLEALDALAAVRAITGEDVAALRETYVLFRRIENRLRVQHGRSTSQLPIGPDERAKLAKRLHIDSDLAELTARHKVLVHSFYRAALARVHSDV